VYFNNAKIDRTIFTKVGSSLISLFNSFLTNKRHPSDFEPSYILIFMSIQSAVYPVGRSTDWSLFTRIIVYNYKDLGQNLVLIFAFGCPACAPNFSSIKACIPELEWFLCLCEKKRKKNEKLKLKLWSLVQLVSRKTAGTIYFNFGMYIASCYRQALPPQIWCSSDKRSGIFERVKIATLLFLLIYSLPFAHSLFSWAARHTTMCLDQMRNIIQPVHYTRSWGKQLHLAK